MSFSHYFPILDWGRRYTGEAFISDLLAALVVTILLIPQSLAYALLAGLPPQVGLYASMLPLLLYAVFGSSRGLSVGPVAVVSLMTASAIGAVAQPGSIGYLEAAIALALLSGLMLFAMGALRLGFIANFLSHPVISGFITASGIIIALSQTRHLLGVPVSGHNLLEIAGSLSRNLGSSNAPTVAVALIALGLLLWARSYLKPLLMKLGMSEARAAVLARTGPVWAILVTTLLVAGLQLDNVGVATLGVVPAGLPRLHVPAFDLALWGQLAGSALLISLVGFVESVSVAQTLGARNRESIDPDQELLGLGAANIGSAIAGGFPVTGGFSRSVVNVDAGAVTLAAGIFTAVGIALATLFLTPWLAWLPKATLGATIVVAVLSLVDVATLRRTWNYARSDFLAVAATILATLVIGVEVGILVGVSLSLFAYLYRTSQPHYAVVGQVPGTEHFRNVNRHKVIVGDQLLSIRVDASLYFANARFLENCVYQLVVANPKITDLVLMCTAVNDIDASALDTLESINQKLHSAGVRFHLSEVKGPVMDKLQRSEFLHELTGSVFLSHYQAALALAPAVTERIGNQR